MTSAQLWKQELLPLMIRIARARMNWTTLMKLMIHLLLKVKCLSLHTEYIQLAHSIRLSSSTFTNRLCSGSSFYEKDSTGF